MNTGMDNTASTTRTLNDSLKALAVAVARAGKSPAQSAALRRGSPADVLMTATFHRLLVEAEIDVHSSERLLPWAAVAQCMAIAGAPDAPLQDGGMLARSGYTESRFSRLLTASDNTLLDLMLMAARFLHAKGHAARWNDLGALVVTDSNQSESTERVRLRLARQYYKSAD